MIIKSANFLISNAHYSKCPQTGLPEYAFIGRSNVGKSSLINMLVGRNKLAMISSTPGKTLLINHFIVNEQWYLVDLPGYGYAQRSKTQTEKLQKLIEGYILGRTALTNLFLLIDSRLPPQVIDLEFIDWLGECGVPFAIIFTKADKSKRAELKRNVDTFLHKLQETWETLPPYFVTSAKGKQGREEVLAYIDQINQSALSD